MINLRRGKHITLQLNYEQSKGYNSTKKGITESAISKIDASLTIKIWELNKCLILLLAKTSITKIGIKTQN